MKGTSIMLLYISAKYNNESGCSTIRAEVIDGHNTVVEFTTVPLPEAKAKVRALQRIFTESNLTGSGLEIILDDNELAKSAEQEQIKWGLGQEHDSEWGKVFEAYSKRFSCLATYVGETVVSKTIREEMR